MRIKNKILISILVVGVFASIPAISQAANRYWVGGTGNWSATSSWAATSGGAGGETVPTSGDNVIFDSLSNATDYTATMNVTANSADFTVGAPLAGKVTLAGTSTLNIYGSVNLSGGTAGITVTRNAPLNFRATTTGKTITLNGVLIEPSSISFDGVGGGWTFQDDIPTAPNLTFYLKNGSLNTNSKTITRITRFSSNYSSTRSLTLGNSTITITGTGTGWNFATVTGLTFDAGGSTIKMNSFGTDNDDFVGGGLTYNNVWSSGTAGAGAVTISGNNTFNDLKINAGRKFKFTDGTTQTVSSFTAIGESGNQITLTGTGTGGWTISDSTGTNSVSYNTISYSTATGGATWNAFTANGNVDGGNNSGWIFTAPPPTTPTRQIKGVGISR